MKISFSPILGHTNFHELLPLEIHLNIYACNFNLNDIKSCSLTCRKWKKIIENSSMNDFFFTHFSLPKPNSKEGVLKVYPFWIKNAEYYFMLDVSSSMKMQYYEALNKLAYDAKKCLIFAKNIKLATCNFKYNIEAIQNEREMNEAVNRLITKSVDGCTDFSQFFNMILNTHLPENRVIKMPNVAHIQLYSDFDIPFSYYSKFFFKIFKYPGTFSCNLNTFGVKKGSKQFINGFDKLKAKIC